MTANEAAAKLGVSRQRVHQLIIEGRLRSELRGRDHDIEALSIDEEITRRLGELAKAGEK